MAGSSDANNVPKGTTLAFGSWACTADGTGGLSSHLVTSDSPKPKTSTQLADVRNSADLGKKKVLDELNSDKPENMPIQNQAPSLEEFGTNSDSEKPHFSETLGKYVAHLKTSKRPRVKNSKLLAGVDRVSRSIEGCIKLAETALGSSSHNPEASKPAHKKLGDLLSGID